MWKIATLIVVILGLAPLASAQSHEDMVKRLDEAATVFTELFNAPDADLPEGLLERAECVAVIPGVRRVGFGFGGQYGRGAATCRGGEGGWSAPSMVAIDGGSFGLQIGGSATDVVLLFMTDDGIEHLVGSEVTLGGDASIAAGPKGRNAGADTTLNFDAEILSYGRSRGLFAGLAIEGSSLRPDRDANEALYGQEITAETILRGGVGIPAGGARFIDVIRAN